MKFKVGDKVKIKEKIENYHGIGKEILSKMREGDNVWTIKKISKGEKYNYYNLKEDPLCCSFGEDMLERVEYTYEDLKKSPTGTKITFENGEVLVKDNDGNYSNKKRWRDDSDLKELKDRINTLGKIVKIEEPEYTTVYEYKPEILDEAEKRYLRGVIRPYSDRIESIEKFIFSTGRAKITITVKDGNDYWYINLPPFEKDTMYKNMKDDEQYTLEELGL